MTWEQLREHLIGKTFLIGLTFNDKYGDCIDQFQTHGIVEELTDEGLFIIRRKDNSIFQMPYLRDSIQKAEDMEYRETVSGDIIVNPDFIMTWEITTLENDNIDEIKRIGFTSAK